MNAEDLIDPNDGENQAVRSFLLLYSGTPGLTFGTMKKHLKMSGYPYWPDWVNGLEGEHLNKLGAQNWLRYLFALESETESKYHPCTHILIEGLKNLPGGHNVLSDWDFARAKIDQ